MLQGDAQEDVTNPMKMVQQNRGTIMAQVPLDNLKKTIRDYSQEIRLVKKSVGLDKPSREKEKGESVPDYLAKTAHMNSSSQFRTDIFTSHTYFQQNESRANHFLET